MDSEAVDTETLDVEAIIQFVDDRPTSWAAADDLYQWAVDAEDHIRTMAEEISRLRGELQAGPSEVTGAARNRSAPRS